MLRTVLTLGVCLPLLTACNRPPRAAPVQRSGGNSATASAPRFRQLPLSLALTNAHEVLLADLNGDGKLDAVVFPQDETGENAAPRSASEVRIALGDGAGGFTAQQTLSVPLPGVTVNTSADFNADGHIDLALGWHDSFDAYVLFGPGGGATFSSPARILLAEGSRAHTHSLLAADVNADGRADLLSTCADDNAVAVQLAQSGGGFAPAPGSPFASGTHPYDNLNCVDIDGDGALDVVIANLHGNTVSVLRGDGTGRLAQMAGSPLAAGERPGYATVGDIDNDGHLDILATHDDDPLLAVHYGDGKGGFTAAPGSPLTLPARLWEVYLVDLDGDGANELLGAETLAPDGAVLVFPGGRYANSVPAPQRIEVGGGELHYVQAAELNGDGKLDLVVGFWDTRDAVVLLQE